MLTSRRHQLPVFALTLVLAAALALLGVGHQADAAKPPAPTRIQIDAVRSTTAPPVGTPTGAQPYVLAEAGQSISVDVSFYDGTVPAAFQKATQLSVTSPQAPVTVISAVAPANGFSATLTISVDRPVNQVSLVVDDVASGGSALKVAADTSDPGQVFDVVEDLRFESSGPGFQEGIGGADDCTVATPENPVCGIVVLPNGAVSPQVLLSIGACDPDGTPAESAYARCISERGRVVQTLADLGNLYSKNAPATVIMKCDKSLCGTGAIQRTTLAYSLSGNAPLQTVPACPGKQTIGADQDACVDYVQSQRDGSGDTHLYFLFTVDARISVG